MSPIHLTQVLLNRYLLLVALYDPLHYLFSGLRVYYVWGPVPVRVPKTVSSLSTPGHVQRRFVTDRRTRVPGDGDLWSGKSMGRNGKIGTLGPNSLEDTTTTIRRDVRLESCTHTERVCQGRRNRETEDSLPT